MSQENVEVVRAIWGVFMRAGFPADAFSDDVEWHTATDLPDSGSGSEPLRGPAQVARMLADGWENVEVPWLRILGERARLCRAEHRGGRGHDSGHVPVRQRGEQVPLVMGRRSRDTPARGSGSS
jgi:hypothetical protein